ncbi:hypothetical protein FDC22_05895 [Clostridium botulinum]|uniref:Uncharacterized protein n=1 Tax=Clostridium botulinum (strain Okra / Type B1) TaxID=498213 RepID=B1IIQ4_CLOBK|nr:hypothetical protein CLD_2094 [Clostridium botulinum B1 str. Okra]EKX81034.1 hypothetical protein CFSAN001628_002797 [Clostridium botulinum CFSAN001628]NFD73499.1 hypothetical protein [Clostridium botulinum]NFD81662.1 hypothetical protein [Clostridium botulinum]NFE19434.1 hypothetical protein [Clostridium botulinum]
MTNKEVKERQDKLVDMIDSLAKKINNNSKEKFDIKLKRV